jgi:hypothetical protein
MNMKVKLYKMVFSYPTLNVRFFPEISDSLPSKILTHAINDTSTTQPLHTNGDGVTHMNVTASSMYLGLYC